MAATLGLIQSGSISENVPHISFDHSSKFGAFHHKMHNLFAMPLYYSRQNDASSRHWCAFGYSRTWYIFTLFDLTVIIVFVLLVIVHQDSFYIAFYTDIKIINVIFFWSNRNIMAALFYCFVWYHVYKSHFFLFFWNFTKIL